MRYDTSLQPPAPVVDVVIRNPYASGPEYGCRALLDTAAEISVVPQSAVETLLVAEAQRISARSWDGSRQEALTYIVRIEFEGGVVPFVEAVAADRPTALLGRDVLNLLRLLLDGPALTLEILPTH